jgi:hypothetical protein
MTGYETTVNWLKCDLWPRIDGFSEFDTNMVTLSLRRTEIESIDKVILEFMTRKEFLRQSLNRAMGSADICRMEIHRMEIHCKYTIHLKLYS